jgi:hypothetical protein
VNSKIFPGLIPQTPLKGEGRGTEGREGKVGKGRRVGLGEGKGWEGEGRKGKLSGNFFHYLQVASVYRRADSTYKTSLSDTENFVFMKSHSV